MRPRCRCTAHEHTPRLVVLTGGPGAGKTAALEVIRRQFCAHVAVLPESASILFGGGFPRGSSLYARRAAQRAICRVELELERMALEERRAGLVLCDRGTADALAYWPGNAADLWSDLGTTREAQLERYATVIHLRVPSASNGYDHSNPLRVETAEQARALDAGIFAAWDGHPRRFVIDDSPAFFDKIERVIARVREEVPACCQAIA